MLRSWLIGVTVLCSPTSAAGQPEDRGPSGASVVFTSRAPAVARVRELMAEGRLAQAERALAAGNLDPNVVDELREIIRRTRHEYDLDATGLLERLRESIPDAGPADVERWRQSGGVQWREIDGEIWYFHREPANVFRFCEDAKRRREAWAERRGEPAAGAATKQERSRRIEHITAVIQAAEQSGEQLVVPLRHRVLYRLTVKPGRAEKGAVLRCWLPFAQDYRQQTEVRLVRTSPPEHVITPDGPPSAGHQTVYLQQQVADASQAIVFEEEFEYTGRAYYPVLRDEQARPLPDSYDGGQLGERPPHIMFTPELRRAVREAIGDERNPLTKARRIFHHVADTIRYCAEEEYSIIPSLSGKALATKRGDCGVQSILFITMCRAAGIPARWQSGWTTDPQAWDMHDWAEFYVEPWGWLPADVSFGPQASDDPRVHEFYFGHLDSYRLIVNLDYGQPLHPAKRSLRSEPCDFQRGEVEADGRNLYFDDWDWQVTFAAEPLGAGDKRGREGEGDRAR